MVAVAALVIMVIAVAGVAGALLLRPDDDPSTASTTSTTSEPTTTTSEPPPDQDQDGNNRIDDPGPPPGHTEPDLPTSAPEVVSLNHGVHDGFERVSITFSGDLPPSAELTRDPDRGLLRLEFSGVDPSGADDGDAITQLFGEESAFGLAAFLVIDENDEAFVDIHADTPIIAQEFRLITEDRSPVIAIDIEGDTTGGVWNPSPIDATGGVILEPIPDAQRVGSTSMDVSAYGRRDDLAGLVEVIDGAGAVVGSMDVSVPAAGVANGLVHTTVTFAEPLAPGPYTVRFSGTAPDGSPAAVESTFTVQ